MSYLLRVSPSKNFNNVGQNEGQFDLFFMHDVLKCLWQETSQWPSFKFLTAERCDVCRRPHGSHLAPQCSLACAAPSNSDGIKDWQVAKYHQLSPRAVGTGGVLHLSGFSSKGASSFTIPSAKKQPEKTFCTDQHTDQAATCLTHSRARICMPKALQDAFFHRLFPGVYSFLRCPGEEVFGR